jgi:uncharacterized circularly permuted ATP-grasp superfamily protein
VSAAVGDLFSDYDRGGFFDEVFDRDGEVRPHYRGVVARLQGLTPDDLERRESIRDALFRSQGITFTVYGDDDGLERTFPMDLLPRIIPADEWDVVERGVAQRVTALNRFLEDLYVGEQAAVHDQVVPRWLIHTAEGFRPEAFGIPFPHAARCLVSGVDLVRDDEGAYLVLEDNLRNPSGISYVLENRAAMTRVLPQAFASERVRPVDHYGPMLMRALREVAPPAAGEHPRAVVLTPGVHNAAYFEHAFLARQMGVELVEASDLVVRDGLCYMRTTRGLARVDSIYRRIDDDFMDPLEFRADSLLGVPGLMGAYRTGTVAIANAVGTGVADDKAVYHYVPEMIRYYLGEEPILDNLPTWLLADPEQRAYVLEHMHELVVKPTGESGGKGVFIGPHANEEQLEAERRLVEEAPERWIAQQTVALSTVPTVLPDGSLAPRHVDLRPFAVYGEEIKIVPGGLTRVALREGSMIVNSSQGGGSKDTWVLAEDGRPEMEDAESQLAPPALPGMRQPGWRGQAQQQQQAAG